MRAVLQSGAQSEAEYFPKGIHERIDDDHQRRLSGSSSVFEVTGAGRELYTGDYSDFECRGNRLCAVSKRRTDRADGGSVPGTRVSSRGTQGLPAAVLRTANALCTGLYSDPDSAGADGAEQHVSAGGQAAGRQCSGTVYGVGDDSEKNETKQRDFAPGRILYHSKSCECVGGGEKMEIYLFGTYENSMRGYVLNRLEEEGLRETAANEKSAEICLVREFFFHDVFRVVWMDFCLEQKAKGFRPQPDWSMAVIRGLQGRISGRKAAMNLAVCGQMKEVGQLGEVTLNFLGDREFYTGKLFGSLRIDGGVFQAEPEKLRESLTEKSGTEDCSRVQEYKGGRLWKRLTCTDLAPITRRDLFRFAVCTSTWEEAAGYFQPPWLWKKPPKGVIDRELFEKLFPEWEKNPG